ncbi:hypothetical protein [Daejeonella sp.]|uniref:hypothetical protein n=1 Tax=Daejeonella sp. TaxID=2805397 RepID=UPI00272FED20|nr:hypothetical protein [Daejeonella sp.]MDP2412739.1 hypothetical protein [Daejeonella sp.]
MSEMNHPVLGKNAIIKSTIIALVLGITLLITAVLPAEYGMDPTGAGKLFGFSRLYVAEEALGDAGSSTQTVQSNPLIKLEKAGSGPDVPRPAEANNPAPVQQFTLRNDSVQVTVPAGKGIEYKINMLKYGTMKYEWVTDTGTVYFDFHGEVKQGKEAKAVYFESYTIAYSNNMVGTFLSPYEGKHGWFFRNNSDKDIVVTLRLQGEYTL